MYMYVHVHVHGYIYMYLYMYMCTYVRVHVHSFVYVYMYMYMYMYVHNVLVHVHVSSTCTCVGTCIVVAVQSLDSMSLATTCCKTLIGMHELHGILFMQRQRHLSLDRVTCTEYQYTCTCRGCSIYMYM